MLGGLTDAIAAVAAITSTPVATGDVEDPRDTCPVSSPNAFVIVNVDDQVPVATRTPQTLMTGIQARDPQTLEITWKQPYLQAGALTKNEFVPLPRHLLGDLFAQDHGADQWRFICGAGEYQH